MAIETVDQSTILAGAPQPMAVHTSSLVHPKYKTKYAVKNWSEYDRGLRNRGDVTIWFGEDAICGWTPRACAAEAHSDATLISR